jgi:hypothetical protein
VSRTVKDLVVGSGLQFSDRGTHETQGRARCLAAIRRSRIGKSQAECQLTANARLFLAEVQIPSLNLRELTEIVLDDLGGRQPILGRNELRDCVLVYDGPRGTVQLQK